MKKITLLLLLIIFISCSNDDYSNSHRDDLVDLSKSLDCNNVHFVALTEANMISRTSHQPNDAVEDILSPAIESAFYRNGQNENRLRGCQFRPIVSEQLVGTFYYSHQPTNGNSSTSIPQITTFGVEYDKEFPNLIMEAEDLYHLYYGLYCDIRTHIESQSLPPLNPGQFYSINLDSWTGLDWILCCSGAVKSQNVVVDDLIYDLSIVTLGNCI